MTKAPTKALTQSATALLISAAIGLLSASPAMAAAKAPKASKRELDDSQAAFDFVAHEEAALKAVNARHMEARAEDSRLSARIESFFGDHEAQFSFFVLSHQDHTLGFYPADLSRSQVHQNSYCFSNHFFRS